MMFHPTEAEMVAKFTDWKTSATVRLAFMIVTVTVAAVATLSPSPSAVACH